MARRRPLGCLVLALVCTSMACKEKGDAAATEGSAVDPAKRCEQLGKLCGDKAKHVDKIIDECKLAAKAQGNSACAAKVNAVYDCYEKELCGGGDRVWTIEDLRVLADRKNKCVTERTSSRECTEKK